MRIRGGIEELLEMLLPSHAAYSFFIHYGLMGGCNQSSVKRTEAKLQWGEHLRYVEFMERKKSAQEDMDQRRRACESQ
jgi:hypothetical protein